MATETELKMRIAPQQLARLKRHALLKQHQTSRTTTRRLYNIYFDTPKLELHDSAMALRLRRSGRQWLQTLKGGGSVRAGLHERNEWEVPVQGAALDFSLLSEKGEEQVANWDELLPASLRRKLHPVFITDFSRSSRMLLWQGAHIELCMDQGILSTEQLSTSFCEIELELKSGLRQQLFTLALAILDIVPFELELISKAEQGYRLLSGYEEHPVKAATVNISRKDTFAVILQSLLWSCLLHFQSNLRRAIAGDEAEYLHQMRVALRRLRVVLRMLETLKADQELSVLNREVAALCVALGHIREWDVFIAQTLRPVCMRMSRHAGLKVLLKASERQRDACHVAIHSEQKALEMQRLILRFAIWMHGPYWQQLDLPGAYEFAGGRLQKLAKRFTRAGDHLDTLDAPHLHALRIIAKKLRYSAEFFSGLYDRKKAGSYMTALSDVQEVLGQINDIAVAHRLLNELSMEPDVSTHQEAVVLVRGWIAHDLSGQFIALRKVMQRFSAKPIFW